MLREDDKRLTCSSEKKEQIKKTLLQTKLRRQSQVVKTFECKVKTSKLSSSQKEQLDKLFLEAKWFYNYLLRTKNESECKLNDINTTNITSVIHLTKDNEDVESELEILSSQHKRGIQKTMVANEKTIATLVKNGYQRHGSLKFKSEVNCVPFSQYKNTYVFKSQHKVRLTGIKGKVYVNGTNQFLGIDGVEIANANLVRRADGFFLYVTTYWSKDRVQTIQCNGKQIGIDFGCQTNLTLSDGTKINMQVEESGRLKRFQQKLERQQKRSNNYMKTLNLLGREYQKMKNKKQDMANQFIHKMKAYERVVIQDEQIANWHKDGHGKKVQHSCMGTIKAKLKALPNVVVLDKFIPTTKWCECGYIHKDIDETIRTLKCPVCHRVEDRDVHAANNMLKMLNLVLQKNLVPRDAREVKLVDFRAAAGIAKDDEGKAQEVEARRCSVFS